MNVQEATTRRLPDLKGRYLPENCRETINSILKETYGYEQFRNLEIYDDLSKGKEKLCISQGQLIENVILEAEKAWKGETQVDNILLTAPLPAPENPCCSSFLPSIWGRSIICLPLWFPL